MAYISIEGLDGAGKSTAAKAVINFFTEKNRNITRVQEPGGTPLAERLRALVKEDHEGEDIDERSETLIFFAARNQLLSNVVVPAIERGDVVVSDRCYLSSVAYQNNSLVEYLCENEMIARPELIIYMDITPEIGLKRAKSREELDRIEKKGTEFFHRTRNNYLAYAEKHDYVKTVDAHPSIEEVYNSVWQVLEDHYGK